MRTTTIRRAIASGAALTVASIGLVAAGTAAQAASAAADFNCNVPILGARAFTVTADTNLPATVEQGKKVSYTFSANVSVPNDVRASALAFFGQEVEGSADIRATVAGEANPVTAALPRTAIPAATGPLVLDVAGTGSWTPAATGKQEVRVDGFVANLFFVKNGVKAKTPTAIECKAPASGAVVVDTVEVTPKATDPKPVPVVKKATKTTVKAKAKAKKQVAVTVSVKSGKTKATGKVTIKLKKGKKTIRTVTKTLKRGSVKVTFKAKKKDSYKVTASYKGSTTLKASTGSKKVRVR